MAKNIEPKLKKIGDYLQLEDSTFFTIPEYQRAYSWKTENCDKLWQDIIDFVACDSKDPYFFGTIIINCQNDDEQFGLIDGQQRTTTFLLLLKALLVRINVAIGKTSGDEESASLCRGLKERRRRIMSILYKVETEDISDEPNYEKDIKICTRDVILENYSINERYKSELGIILKSYDYVSAESNVYKIPYKQKDNKYTNFFRNFKFFYEKAVALSDSELNTIAKTITDKCEVIQIKSWQVEQAITMFNSLNSDGLPLYDSDIISAQMYAAAEKKNQGVEFNNKWEALLDIISELKEKGIASIDSILMQQMYYSRASRREIITDNGSINVTTPGLRRYFTDINKDLINNPVETCSGMINLANNWKIISNYPIAQVLFKFNENSKLFLASYLYKLSADDVEEAKVTVILENLLRLFALLEIVDIGYSSSLFKTFLFGEEVKLVDSSISEQIIKEDFSLHINTKWNKSNIADEISECNKHVLVYLNEYLYAKEHGLDFNFTSKYDIEHIMPNSGHNLQEIRKDAGIETEEEFKTIVNKLGNKILLEEKINRSIGNEWFRTKVSTHLDKKTGYVDSKYPIACALVQKYQNEGKPYWKKEDIQHATNEAAQRIVKFIFGEE